MVQIPLRSTLFPYTTLFRSRWRAIQWLHFQMGGVGPMFGQVGFFHKFAGKDFEDKRSRDRYVAESKRLLGRSEEHTSELQSHVNLVCRLLLEKKKQTNN